MDAPTLLSRPPEEGARRLALSFLDQAAAAFPRLDDPEDSKALHDFRVALRRLRSCLRAYEQPLEGSVAKKLARRLRRLAAATGPGRDSEVQVEWLQGRAKHLRPGQRPGLAWQLTRLKERMAGAYSDLRTHVAEEFLDLEQDLRRNLSVYRAEVHLGASGPQPTFGELTSGILRRQLADLQDHLGRIEEAGDQEKAHRARISAKRLRYLLEPFMDEKAGAMNADPAELPGAAPLVKRLKGLQDLLGELHDAHVLEIELAEAVETAALERAHRLFALMLEEQPDPAQERAIRRRPHEPGLLALARHNRERRDRLFSGLDEDWLGGRSDAFFQAVEALAQEMEEAGNMPPDAARNETGE